MLSKLCTLSHFKNATLINSRILRKKKFLFDFETTDKESIHLCVIHAKKVAVRPHIKALSDAKVGYPPNTSSYCKGPFSVSYFHQGIF